MASYRVKSNPYSENAALFRYAYIDKSSDLHILFPISGGEVIGTDNTCQSTKELKSFIQDTGNFLRSYISALESDLRREDSSLAMEDKNAKSKRLAQARSYLKNFEKLKSLPVFNNLHFALPDKIQQIIYESSNISSVVLRPELWDPNGVPTHRNFSVDYTGRTNRADCLAARLRANFAAKGEMRPATPGLKDSLKAAVYEALKDSDATTKETLDDADYEAIFKTLQEQSKLLFGEGKEIPCAQYFNAEGAPGDYIEPDIGNYEDYIDFFLNGSSTFFEQDDLSLVEGGNVKSIFAEIVNGHSHNQQERNDKLSIATQFLLAQVNSHLQAYQLKDINYNLGQIVEDLGEEFQAQLAKTIIEGIEQGKDIEIDIINKLNETFSLAIDEELAKKIKQQFISHWGIIKESPHFDNFNFITEPGPDSNLDFTSHCGVICTDFLKILDKYQDDVDFESYEHNPCFTEFKDFSSLLRSERDEGLSLSKNGNAPIATSEQEITDEEVQQRISAARPKANFTITRDKLMDLYKAVETPIMNEGVSSDEALYTFLSEVDLISTFSHKSLRISTRDLEDGGLEISGLDDDTISFLNQPSEETYKEAKGPHAIISNWTHRVLQKFDGAFHPSPVTSSSEPEIADLIRYLSQELADEEGGKKYLFEKIDPDFIVGKKNEILAEINNVIADEDILRRFYKTLGKSRMVLGLAEIETMILESTEVDAAVTPKSTNRELLVKDFLSKKFGCEVNVTRNSNSFVINSQRNEDLEGYVAGMQNSPEKNKIFLAKDIAQLIGIWEEGALEPWLVQNQLSSDQLSSVVGSEKTGNPEGLKIEFTDSAHVAQMSQLISSNELKFTLPIAEVSGPEIFNFLSATECYQEHGILPMADYSSSYRSNGYVGLPVDPREKPDEDQYRKALSLTLALNQLQLRDCFKMKFDENKNFIIKTSYDILNFLKNPDAQSFQQLKSKYLQEEWHDQTKMSVIRKASEYFSSLQVDIPEELERTASASRTTTAETTPSPETAEDAFKRIKSAIKSTLSSGKQKTDLSREFSKFKDCQITALGSRKKSGASFLNDGASFSNAYRSSGSKLASIAPRIARRVRIGDKEFDIKIIEDRDSENFTISKPEEFMELLRSEATREEKAEMEVDLNKAFISLAESFVTTHSQDILAQLDQASIAKEAAARAKTAPTKPAAAKPVAPKPKLAGTIAAAAAKNKRTKPLSATEYKSVAEDKKEKLGTLLPDSKLTLKFTADSAAAKSQYQNLANNAGYQGAPLFANLVSKKGNPGQQQNKIDTANIAATLSAAAKYFEDDTSRANYSSAIKLAGMLNIKKEDITKEGGYLNDEKLQFELVAQLDTLGDQKSAQKKLRAAADHYRKIARDTASRTSISALTAKGLVAQIQRER